MLLAPRESILAPGGAILIAERGDVAVGWRWTAACAGKASGELVLDRPEEER
jgi:hypothetical protein